MTLSEFILAWRELAPTTKGRCFYCGTQTGRSGLRQSNALFQTKDHVIPVSAKTRMKLVAHNVVIACRKCNSKKEDLTMQEFKRRIGIQTFYAEEILGVRIDDLTDIAMVTFHIQNTRTLEGRSIKFHGRIEPRVRPQESPQPTTNDEQG
jgi:hypothetical protein